MNGWDPGDRSDLLLDSEDDGQDIEPRRGKKQTAFPLPSGFRVHNGTQIAVQLSIAPNETKKRKNIILLTKSHDPQKLDFVERLEGKHKLDTWSSG